MDEVDLYLVRVWHQPAFRASVRRVGVESARFFSDPAELTGYLRDDRGTQTQPPGAALEPAMNGLEPATRSLE